MAIVPASSMSGMVSTACASPVELVGDGLHQFIDDPSKRLERLDQSFLGQPAEPQVRPIWRFGGGQPSAVELKEPHLHHQPRGPEPKLMHSHWRCRCWCRRGLVSHRICRVRTNKTAIVARIATSRSWSTGALPRAQLGGWSRGPARSTDSHHRPVVKTHHSGTSACRWPGGVCWRHSFVGESGSDDYRIWSAGASSHQGLTPAVPASGCSCGEHCDGRGLSTRRLLGSHRSFCSLGQQECGRERARPC